MANKVIRTSRQRKRYLNRNIKTLINIAKLSKDGKMKFSEFQDLAREEDIQDKKFHTHLNQACHLGYLKKYPKYIQFIKDYD